MADLDRHRRELQVSQDEVLRLRQLVSSKDSIIKDLRASKRSVVQELEAALLGMATGTYPSGSTISYPYPSKKILPVGLPIYIHGYKILPIPVPARVFLPVG
jgi:hypothetical protein